MLQTHKTSYSDGKSKNRNPAFISDELLTSSSSQSKISPAPAKCKCFDTECHHASRKNIFFKVCS